MAASPPPKQSNCFSFLNQPFIAQLMAGATLTLVSLAVGLVFGVYKQMEDFSDLKVDFVQWKQDDARWKDKMDTRLTKQEQRILVLETRQ